MGKQYGQDIIDNLRVLEAVLPTLHEEYWPRVVDVLPKIVVTLRSKYAIIRQSASRCIATICNVLTANAMRYVIENVIPLLGDAVVLTNRQGAAELMYRKRTSYAHHGLLLILFLRYCPEIRYQGTPLCDLHDRACSWAYERFR
jgi:TATA-binding protein-associated factor